MNFKAKRETIILGVAILAIIGFLVYTFVLPLFMKSASVLVEAEKVDVQKLLGEMGEYAKKDGSIDNIIYTVSKAELTWPRDPFLNEDLASAAAVESRKDKFIYTGFIMLGGKKLAVINGIEYQVGEALTTEGFVVRAINPNDVVLEDSTNKSRLSIPIQE
jgi:hypothetical protein